VQESDDSEIGAPVWCLTSLTLLNVSVNNISLASMRHLALSLATLYNLRELNLQGNFLGRKSAAVVAPALMHLSHLHELVLGRNQLVAAGATAIADCLRPRVLLHLRNLRLWQNDLGDAGAVCAGRKLCADLARP